MEFKACDIVGRFRVAGQRDERFVIWTRATGLATNPYGDLDDGIVFRVQVENDTIGIDEWNFQTGISRNLAAGKLRIETGKWYDFRVVDTGLLVRFYIENLERPLLTASTNFRKGGRIGFNNKEKDGCLVEVDGVRVNVPGAGGMPLQSSAEAQPLAKVPPRAVNSNVSIDPVVGTKPRLAIATPTNNLVELSQVNGEVIYLDSKGVVVRTEGGVKRIRHADMTDGDRILLMDTGRAYAALTGLKSPLPRGQVSENLEQVLDKVWQDGVSLLSRQTNRLAILEAMRDYNIASSTYHRLAGTPEIDLVALSREGLQAFSRATDAIEDIRRSTTRRELRNATSNVKKALQDSDEASSRAEGAERNNQILRARTERARQDCLALEAQLAKLGVSLNLSPNFLLIPTISVTNAVNGSRSEMRKPGMK